MPDVHPEGMKGSATFLMGKAKPMVSQKADPVWAFETTSPSWPSPLERRHAVVVGAEIARA